MAESIDRLQAFYGRAGMRHRTLRYFSELSLFAGAFTARPVSSAEQGGATGASPLALTWGEPLAARLRSEVRHASDDELAQITGTTIHLDVDHRRGRIASGSALPSVLCESVGQGRRAWSTHAVAAAFLANGTATLHRDALPEYLATEFVGGGETLVREASALDPATVIEIEPHGCRRRTFASPRLRWARMPARQARATAQATLGTTLAERAQSGEIWLGLTEGLDSLAVAIALKRRGVAFRAFTWGEPDWPDAVGARRVATRLGIDHVLLRPQTPSSSDLYRSFMTQVRGSDGAIRLNPLATLAFPEPIDEVVTGGGGEIGRAFYYRQTARNFTRPTSHQLQRVLSLERAITGARPEAMHRVQRSVTAWIDASYEAGATGWRCLDVVYGEQRVRKWGRAMIPMLPAPTVAAFATADMARALMSMPLEDRLTSAAQRKLIQSEFGDEYVQLRGLQRRGVPPPVRRFSAAVRSRRAARWSPREWELAGIWQQLPDVREWLADQVLGSSAIVASMGEAWARTTRDGLLRGMASDTEMALRAAGPATLDSALDELVS